MPQNPSPLSGLKRQLRVTRAGMVAEELVRAFWPALTIAMASTAAMILGIGAVLSGPVLMVLGAIALAGFVWALVKGIRRFHIPSQVEAEARFDMSLPGRPIATLQDSPANGADDPGTAAVWHLHLTRMAERLRGARAPAPDLRVAARDPLALRLAAAVALAVAFIFGSISSVGNLGPIGVTPSEASTASPAWEGWIEPPLYTNRPSLYLNDITREAFEVPVGSRITVRFYGSNGDLSLRHAISDMPPPEGYLPTDPAQEVILDHSGEFAIDGPGGRAWRISALADQAPAVAFAGPVEGIPPGQFQLPFTATDDYAVVAGQARITLNADAADRRYGLRIDPEPREAVVLDLPMPFSGSREDFTELLIEDLSQHPFANLPVTISLEVTDHRGQIGQFSQDIARLPGRRFFDPLANALIEMRRDLLWSRENATRSAQILRALTWEGDELWTNRTVLMSVRSVIGTLEAETELSPETRDELAELLWEAAIALEEGDLANALEQLRRAQDRLAEAMRQGASDQEIEQLMQELREAMDEYIRELAENAEPAETDQPDQSGETQELSMSDIEEMMERIEELIQEGRMAEAMELMEQLRQMMENMQVTQGGNGEGPQSPGQQAMEGLQDTLRDQQDLSDDSFRELQDQFSQGQQQQQGQNQGSQGSDGENGADGQAQSGSEGDGMDGRSLAERQQDLLRQLQEQADGLPGMSSESADEAERLLDDAARAMDEAADALGEGALADALDSQSQAMEALREGLGELGRALAEAQGLEEPGQGQAQAQSAPSSPARDPLGRQAGNDGAFGTEENFEQREEAFRRSRELLEELRRRSAELDRPEVELDYLERLLDQF